MEYQEELGLNLYDMDFRDYDPAIGRWTGIDPVTHYNMSPYMAFDGNPVFWADPSGADSVDGIKYTGDTAVGVYNAIIGAMDAFGSSGWEVASLELNSNAFEASGTGPGASFSSALAAAIDFGMNYNGASILNKRECHTTIYRKGDMYSYVVPVVGGEWWVPREQIVESIEKVQKISGAIIVAMAHTHGADQNYRSNEFSGDYFNKNDNGDIHLSKNWSDSPYGRPLDSYLCAPNGGLYYFSPVTMYAQSATMVNGSPVYGFQIPVFWGLPSDPNSNTRLNEISPHVIPAVPIQW